MPLANSPQIGVLLSGGLDSAILLGVLLREGHTVQPLYIRCRLVWERQEILAVRRFLRALSGPRLAELVVLSLPMEDVYGPHWSVTGCHAPDRSSPDEAVYLPGRNLLLVLKAAVWCQLHGIGQLALGVLRSNPFADATDGFFADLQAVLDRYPGQRVEVVRPLAGLEKPSVIRMGKDLPLELTFSCIAPRNRRHCGQCNKCAERIAAFRAAGLADPTLYAVPPEPVDR